MESVKISPSTVFTNYKFIKKLHGSIAMRIKKTTKEILQTNLERESPLGKSFLLFAHNIRSMYNVGSLFRTSDAFGIQALLLSGYTPAPPRPEITKTALGAEETVVWQKVKKPLQKLEELKTAGYLVYGLEQTFQSELLTDLTLQQPSSGHKICVVLGNEVTGIDDTLIGVIDHFIEIPQFGKKHSLNVSVAAGVVLYAFLEKIK